MESKKLNSLITSIAGRSKTMRDDIQKALIGCAFHAQVHRNTDPFNRLFDAVGPGTRLEGMLKWASIYAPVHFKDEKVILSDKRQKECLLSAEELTAELNEAPEWFALAKEEKVANPWDSVAFAEKLAMYLEQSAKKADKAGDPALAALIKDAEMLLRVQLNTAFDAVEF